MLFLTPSGNNRTKNQDLGFDLLGFLKFLYVSVGRCLCPLPCLYLRLRPCRCCSLFSVYVRLSLSLSISLSFSLCLPVSAHPPVFVSRCVPVSLFAYLSTCLPATAHQPSKHVTRQQIQPLNQPTANKQTINNEQEQSRRQTDWFLFP